MPIYFGPVAATCPNSRDQPTADQLKKMRLGRPLFARPTIPHAPDNSLEDAIRVANIARSVVTDLVRAKTINNVYTPKVTPFFGVAKDKFKNTHARWVEQTDKRVRRQYRYYAKNDDGSDDKTTWVIMERIERMVWFDRGWKSYLVWEYGDKGEGEPINEPPANTTTVGGGSVATGETP
jgi:hypothetical protein